MVVVIVVVVVVIGVGVIIGVIVISSDISSIFGYYIFVRDF